MTGAPYLRDLEDAAQRRLMISQFSQIIPNASGHAFSAHHIVEPYDHQSANDICASRIHQCAIRTKRLWV